MRKQLIWVFLILVVIALGFPGLGVGQEKAPTPAPPATAASPAPAPPATAPEPPATAAPPAPAPPATAPEPPATAAPPALAPVPPATTAAPPAEKAPAPAPDPKQILQQMCDFLKNQQQFSFKAEVTDDRVYAGGRKLQFGQEITASFRRPEKLRLDGDGDVESKLLIFDGKTLTLYDKDKNHYGAIEAAGDLDAALEKAGKEYGLHVGLAELGANRLGEHAALGLTNALYVGDSKVQGVPCHHLAFDKEAVHYQLWVEAGDKPLLRKVVVTQKKLPDSPQWTAYLSDWNFSPQLADSIFTFTPPEGAQKIKFMPVKKAEAPAPKKAKPKKKGGAS